jgi:glyoxylase I family protein
VPRILGVAHVSLTVRNLARSQHWYRTVLGLEGVFREQNRSFATSVLRDPESGLVIVLREHHGAGTARFDEKRTGLDHIAFAVTDRHALEEWAKRLTDMEVEHTPLQETDFGWVVVFRDPDHIQLEFFCREVVEPAGPDAEDP